MLQLTNQKLSLDSLLEDLRTKHLEHGQLSLYNINELEADQFMFDIPMLLTSQRLHLDLGDSQKMICKITPQLILEITCSKSEISLGMLRALSTQLSNEIRKSALQSSK